MCGGKSRAGSYRLPAVLLLASVLSCSYLHADVVLRDSEAQEMLDEMEKSRQELQGVQEELAQSKESAESALTESEGLRKDLSQLETTCEEQRKSYEGQLQEARKTEGALKTTATITGTTSVVFLVLMVIFICI